MHLANCFLQTDSISSIWCSGCGIGTVVGTFIQTIERLKMDANKICVVSGIGCTGKIVEYLKLNTFQINDGNIIKYVAKLKSKDPNLKVVAFFNDVDFIAAQADDFTMIREKGLEFLLIFINNFIYRVLIEHKALSKTPFMRYPVKNDLKSPFNIPHFAKSCGAQYIARWTPFHVRRLMYSMTDALQKPGFSMVEIISPCLIYYASNGMIGKRFDRMRFFYENSIIKHNEPTENLDIRFRDKIIIGKFIDNSL